MKSEINLQQIADQLAEQREALQHTTDQRIYLQGAVDRLVAASVLEATAKQQIMRNAIMQQQSMNRTKEITPGGMIDDLGTVDPPSPPPNQTQNRSQPGEQPVQAPDPPPASDQPTGQPATPPPPPNPQR